MPKYVICLTFIDGSMEAEFVLTTDKVKNNLPLEEGMKWNGSVFSIFYCSSSV